MQEEIRLDTSDGSSSKNDDEEDCALAAKARKGKGKKNASQSGADGKEHGMSKVKCFHCHEHGHYATNCPQKKKNKQAAGAAAGEALASQFELDFSLIACMVSSALGSGWYFDSGASFHMTGDVNIFSDLVEKDLQLHVELGDNGRYNATGIGTITFQRESGKLILLQDVVHVPGLKKNLISVAMLEDKGYDVVFSEGKVFLQHKETGQFNKVGIRAKNLYRLEVDGMSTELPTVGKRKEDMQLKLEREQVLHAGKKDMQLMLEREQVLHAGESEPRGVEQPQEDHGMGETTQ